MYHLAALIFYLFNSVYGQQIGTLTAEVAPSLTIQQCSVAGSCVNQAVSLTLDASWRWAHGIGTSTSCFVGNAWNAVLCPDPITCAENCGLDGADYAGTYGIATSGNAVSLHFKTGTNVGSRVFVKSSNTAYQLFKIQNQEFTFDIDLSNVPCGVKTDIYFVGMDADGGLAKYPTNKAGAKYGTGYCDASCPHNVKWINGQANLLSWNPATETGLYGSCCAEFDIFEGNSRAGAFNAHPCTTTGQTRCTSSDCSVCDSDGCDYNSYRNGNTAFLGPAGTINTATKFTVVTQFITNDNTATGNLVEIRRSYIQNGVVIQNSVVNVPGLSAYSSMTNAYCAAQKSIFQNANTFTTDGGLQQLGTAMARGMVLAISIWDDQLPGSDLNWLDSNYPATGNPSTPGVARGPCSTTVGVPQTVEAQSAGASVIFSNFKYGPIGSTTPPPPPPPPVAHFGQCGGIGWTGSTVCASPHTCTYENAYYSQCL